MARCWSDNVHTTAFTPRDYQVELIAAAKEKNVILCLGHKSSKEFIALKLLQELGHEVREKHGHNRKVSLYVTNGGDGCSAYNLVHYLSDLQVIYIKQEDETNTDWNYLLIDNQVVILCASTLLSALNSKHISLENVNIIIIEDCHKDTQLDALATVFSKYYGTSVSKPRIVGLAGPIYTANCLVSRLAGELKQMELLFGCVTETASDIVNVLRYCVQPIERIVQCQPQDYNEVVLVLQGMILSQKHFIEDHRYDPSEIYNDDFSEELQGIPDPKKEPLEFLDNILYILNEMGPWAADRAAFYILRLIEKQKIKTPYERHFMLLCLISTTFVEIRSYCDHLFKHIDEKQRIEKFSSPKVLRLLEILKHFQPNKVKNRLRDENAVTSENSKVAKLHLKQDTETGHTSDRDSTLGTRLENVLNTEEVLHDNLGRVSNTKATVLRKGNDKECLIHTNNNNSKRPFEAKYGGNKVNNRNCCDSDVLCGIVYCNNRTTAKILFNLLSEASRSDLGLSFLIVQYTVDRAADILLEPNEAELEHRIQEEVLKKFRTHECNLLIGTSVLEEGIELPKCNLVVRWDPPRTYRSYVQCKGRVRATNGVHVIMVAPKLVKPYEVVSDDHEKLGHKIMCRLRDNNKKTRRKSQRTLGSRDVEATIIEDTIPENLTDNNQYNEEDNALFRCILEDTDLPINVKKVFELGLENVECSTNKILDSLAQYGEIDKLLLQKCENVEPSQIEQMIADGFTNCIETFKPLGSSGECDSVNLSTAVALLNKYCAKLPSDTFTKLTPLWRCSKTYRNGLCMFLYTLRLPINSPLKSDIRGIPMPSKILARRVAALIACIRLYECGELDNSLKPIGKEAFRITEENWEACDLDQQDHQNVNDNIEPKPGTTKRRQYYYKKIASAFSKCRPTVGSNPYLYHIKLKLECPIPEEQNTRGRKVYAPEDYVQGFGILTLRKIPKVSAFPIYTRSGEVRVSLELSNDNISLDELRINHINAFLSYTFTNVLRLQKYLMLFDSEATENCFLIVPTIRRENSSEVTVDWKFLETISKNSNKMPKPVSEEFRRDAVFDPNKFKDAVVMPWYRNQDQPQYFYIAEICDHLSPQSSFPGENYRTFEEYYLRKYGIRIQNLKQPLLDVDHTSARLNFLTPRYVNRKGVALPTSSDETKRAKRENLEQKQILVPELCTIHPFPASLWRVAVCLPCILYRINALLLADEVRRRVAIDIGLGRVEPLENDFEWPILDFGWSLKEVFRKAVDLKSTKVGCKNKPNVHYVGDDLCKLERNNSKTKLNMENEELINSSEVDSNETPNKLEENLNSNKNECLLEIGTWSNDMAAKITHGDELLGSTDENSPLDHNKVRYASPTSWNIAHHMDSVDTCFLDSDGSYNSDDSTDMVSSDSLRDHSGSIRIEFTSENVAEAFETEEEIQKRQKQLALIAETNPNEKLSLDAQNVESGFDCFLNIATDNQILQNAKKSEEIFNENVCSFVNNMRNSDVLVKLNKSFQICKNQKQSSPILKQNVKAIIEMVPYIPTDKLLNYLEAKYKNCDYVSVTLSLDDLFELNSMYTSSKQTEVYEVEGTGDVFDNFIDGHLEMNNGPKKFILEHTSSNDNPVSTVKQSKCIQMTKLDEPHSAPFSFDYQPNLNNHPGPSPSIILQALTMSNANDGINLERLETIGDSFLKYAITAYLYCNYENVHEGKLSHLRSKQVSNLNLYRLGSLKALGEYMIASKFEPHDNWLPPCYYVPKELEKALIEARIPACQWNLADLVDVKQLSSEEICRLVKSKADAHGYFDEAKVNQMEDAKQAVSPENFPCFIPYNLVTQHSIPDKSIADCVEALIGAYLIECGARGALIFMAWIGIRVLPVVEKKLDAHQTRIAGTTQPDEFGKVMCYGELKPPKSPLLEFVPNAQERLELLLDGYDNFERAIGYEFKDRSYLLQAMTHASYSPNRLSDCYQRLEFLGDAVLDYLITRHLYEDQRKHSPGALTDLRSALVNNTIFASLAVRHGYHKYFRHLSPGLNEVIDRFVRIQHENNHIISEEYYLLSEEECDEAEDVEVPKALGDIFESVAGAIFLDSNMSLDVVWQVYSNMMRPEIEQFSNCVPKSPIRELLELEPETAKFSKPERLADGRRVRVSVEVFGKGNYKGIGRNYRIAKCTAAKCALRQLRKKGLITKKH